MDVRGWRAGGERRGRGRGGTSVSTAIDGTHERAHYRGMIVVAEVRDQLAHDLLARVSPRPSTAAPGSIVQLDSTTGDSVVLAAPGTALADVYRIAGRFGLDPLHPPATEAEAAAEVAAPGFDDPALTDLEHLPFCTIDNADSRDLDQALCIVAEGDGHVVWYALADASYYVRPGTALFDESVRRGASYYLPGLVIPMLPRTLSEDLVSLNADVIRRALVFRAELDQRGAVVATTFLRGRIRSRAKLTYEGVQRHYGDRHLDGHDFTASLDALAVVGRRRIALAEARHVVTYPRIEVAITLSDPQGHRFVAFEDQRLDVDRYNEQVSLLVNSEGARFLAEMGVARPIFRVHPEPERPDFDTFAQRVASLVAHHGLDASWRWSPKRESLADYLARLPASTVALAIQRQALLLNQRSSFAAEPGLHYGVGAALYARFSSPMREVVGIFTHKEALEALAGTPDDPADEALQQAVIRAANTAKDRQRDLTKAANQLVIDGFLHVGLELEGTVLGVGRDRLYLQLDEPPLELKLYAVDLGKDFRLGSDGVSASAGGHRFVLGDRLRVRVAAHDPKRDRWCVVPLPTA